jgi:trimethylamine--corrinoid protein Co-methyltransferase
MSLASLRVEKMLADYQQPSLSADIVESLAEYIAKKKSSMPDSFI